MSVLGHAPWNNPGLMRHLGLCPEQDAFWEWMTGLDFVRTARAKGLPGWLVVQRHVLRNAMLPVVTVIGLDLGVLLGGAVITETIFAWPGVGRLVLSAIQGKDYPLIQGVVLVSALGYVLTNLLVDLSYSALDPRIRHREAAKA